MKTIYIIIITTLFLTVACKEENLLPEQTPQTNEEVQFTDAEQKVLLQQRNEKHQVSMDEALQLANDVIAFFDGEAAVKSGTARKIGSVTAVRAPKTVSLKSVDGTDIAMSDTAAYLFNFADNEGFALISGDTRVETSILGYSDSGTLGDTLDNVGLAVFLEGAAAYMENSIVEAERLKDSLLNSIAEKLVEANLLPETKVIPATGNSGELWMGYNLNILTTYYNWETISHVYPLSKVEWNQGSPYNEHAPLACAYDGLRGYRAWAGCVAVAVAEILSYHQYPSSIGGVALNWSFLNSFTGRPDAYDAVRGKNQVQKTPLNSNDALFNHQVSILMMIIGAEIGTSYGCSGSSSNIDKANNFLRSLGYTTGGVCSYNYNTVIASLNMGRPVIMRGFAHNHDFNILGARLWSTYDGGHDWVIDGYLNQKQKVSTNIKLIALLTGLPITSMSPSITYNYASYLHINWGYDGDSNGWFVAGCFDINASYLESETKGGQDGNYQFDRKIIPHIRH
ncbi:MAG: C10 family peptidase [Prevotellaceae bacterium]|jgi:hypothetical protein|nr:C10 family peptidase [Prevotellaceae bacterium]